MKSENATPQATLNRSGQPDASVTGGKPAGVAPNTQHSEGEPSKFDALMQRQLDQVRDENMKLRAQLEEARRERDEARSEFAAYKRSDAFVNTGAMLDGWERTYKDLTQRALAAESALREATNKALERAAMECESDYVRLCEIDERHDNEVGMSGDGTSFNQGVSACIKAIRSLKTPPVEG